LGDGILVAPIADPGTSRSAWIPPGTWINVWTGSTITGPVTTTVSASLEKMPIFVKRGTLLALAPDMQHTGERAWDPVTLDIYPLPGEASSTVLYEDDGVSNGYKNAAYRKTSLAATVDNQARTITVHIGAADGSYAGALNSRRWKIRVRTPSEWGNTTPTGVTVDGVSTAWNVLSQNSASMPFQVTGGAADATLAEISVSNKSVATLRSVVISYASSPSAVTVYQHCNYTGWAANFNAGNFNLSALQAAGAINNDASSIKVTPGYSATLYDLDNFGGDAVTITGEDSCLVDNNFNDRLTSLRVSHIYKIGRWFAMFSNQNWLSRIVQV